MAGAVDPLAVHRGVPALGAPPGLAHLVRPCGCARFKLTDREQQVLELLAEGRSTREAARCLYVSQQAVTYHIANLLAKFQCTNRTELVARAFVLSVLEPTWPPSVRRSTRDEGTGLARVCSRVKDSNRRRTHR